MIKYIALLIIGVFLAQMAVAAMAVWVMQTKNPLINYKQSMNLYVRINSGRYILVAVLTAIVCFILSEYMNLSLSRADLLKKGMAELTKTERIQLRFKTYSIAVGTFIEVVALVVYRVGFKAILDFGKAKGVETNDLKPLP